ncbi:hypothetical protein [Olsenella urininfantis]|uniref:hypothetical protein n=1 Tax=Olsenella urininfantis TaxID=1871033 RepID=UPI000986A777|nr:hypothetical protein [Olsenella urininfantis]
MTKRITPALLRESADVARKNRKSLVGCSYPVCKAIFGEVEVLDYEYTADALAAALTATADTMERDYLPLPVGADGEPLRLGETVFTGGGSELVIDRITYYHEGGEPEIGAAPDGSGASVGFDAEDLTHERPDSWERIIDDAYNLGGWAEEMVGDGPDYSTTDLVERCRRLAGES